MREKSVDLGSWEPQNIFNIFLVWGDYINLFQKNCLLEVTY